LFGEFDFGQEFWGQNVWVAVVGEFWAVVVAWVKQLFLIQR